MSRDEFPHWFRKRRMPFFDMLPFQGFEEMMKEMERMVEEISKDSGRRFPASLTRERKLPDGRVARELGPMVYGYSFTIDPDGKPVVREFGNLKPSMGRIGMRRPSIDVRDEREPLVDVMSDNGNIKVITELPGVEKPAIKLHATSNNLTILVDSPMRKYFKELSLPSEVNPKTAKSKYKNGVLEVTLRKVQETETKGEPINIE